MALFGCKFVKCSLACCVLLFMCGCVLSKTLLHHHRCSALEGERVIKEDVPCTPRPQVVPIPKSQPHDVFAPTAVMVYRCSGGCSNMRGCTPKAVQSKCVMVEDKINLVYEFREVEEHTECSCCDVTEDMCNQKQEFLDKECTCACKDDSEADECSDKGWDWDPVNCYCMCPTMPCMSSQIWSTKTCRCEDKERQQFFLGKFPTKEQMRAVGGL